ncbi:disulfide bond formation protein DsbB [Sinobacterium caligoides]|uniref:Disulfide bond formation protein B n=1 Tax=Sinobacterium caligoides TaxID=933926 RepID=A0A3N2DQL0_9GAMM|nr:disulfide bond formation protein B [Sinobacterium caligoides]ROS01972.1 disulfide bond formation protein DsbB [Sinobacterium caligoides]
MQLPSIRQTNLVIFLGCCGLMAVGYFMQYMLGLEPCPLCMTQRVFIILTGVWALLAYLHSPALIGTRVYAFLVALSALIGGGFSMRQLHLQSLPAELAPTCGPSIDYMFETFPFTKALEVMLKGDGNCAEVVWTFMGISIPGWTLVAFAGLFMLGLWQLLRGYKPVTVL